MKLTGEESPEEVRAEARAIVMRQLAMMDRSRQQLLDAQTSRKVPLDVAESVVDAFEEAGLVDDRAFAASFVRSRMAERPSSRRGLLADLTRKKGIDREIAEAALEELSPEDEMSAAYAVADKKARLTATLDYEVRRRRIYGALARRGFTPAQCQRALAHALDSDEDDLSSI